MKVFNKIKKTVEELVGGKELKKELEKQNARVSQLSQKIEEINLTNMQLTASIEEFMFVVSELLDNNELTPKAENVRQVELLEKAVQIKCNIDVN